MQEATFAIKNQHRRHIRQTRDPPSLFHNPPSSPRQHINQQSIEYEKPIAKYTVTNLGRSNSGRTPSRPSSASSNHFQDRRLAVERRSLERRPRSDGSSVYPKELLSPQHESSSLKSSPSQQSSDECSSLSSGSGQCSGSGADCQHDCKKRHRLRGKLVWLLTFHAQKNKLMWWRIVDKSQENIAPNGCQKPLVPRSQASFILFC